MTKSDPAAVKVTQWREQCGVAAQRPFVAGERILWLEGRLVTTPDRYTIQLDRDVHLHSEPSTVWRYVNHSCAPNVALRGRDFVAVRAIAVGEELSFDYDSTEWDMASPFLCVCGARECRGMIRGFRHLDATARARLAPLLVEHLRVRSAETAATRAN